MTYNNPLFASLLVLLSILLSSAFSTFPKCHVYSIELTRPIKASHSSVVISPTIYRLEDAIRDDSRILVNTIDVRDVRHVTSALLPRGFIDKSGGIDTLQGRRVHAFIAPRQSDGAEDYRWTAEDFQHITPQSVVILMDMTPSTGHEDDHEHDLLTPEAVDCLIYDKQVSALITNRRYIDGRREEAPSSPFSQCISCNSTAFCSLELALLNHGVVVVVSAAPLSEEDALALAATGPLPKHRQEGQQTAKKYRNSRGRENSATVYRLNRHRHRRQEEATSEGDSFFYAYFHVFQPDRSVPVGLAGVTLLNFTTKEPTSLSHEWYPKDDASFLPVWPGTSKAIVRVTMSTKGSRAILFSEQAADIGEQHPLFFTAPSMVVPQHRRPPRPHVRIKFAEHFGTHVDAPFHMLPNATPVAGLKKEKLFSNCCFKIDLSRKILPGRKSWATERGITIGDYEGYGPVGGHSSGCIALFHTGTSRFWQNSTAYVNHMIFPGISPELALMLLQDTANKHAGVGIDTLSLDPGSSEDLSAHVIAAANGAFVLENLNDVNKLPDDGKPVSCLIIPLRIEGGSAAPAKVVAFLGGQSDYEFNVDGSYPYYPFSSNMAQRRPASTASPVNSRSLSNLVSTLITTLFLFVLFVILL